MTDLTDTEWERRRDSVLFEVLADPHTGGNDLTTRSIQMRNLTTGRTFWATPEGLARKYVQRERPSGPLAVPAGLSADGQGAARIINEFLAEHNLTEFGGGSRFYSPQEWADREEEIANDALLVITHDGGDAATVFSNVERSEALHEQLQSRLRERGLFAETATSWSSGIYYIG